MKSRNRWHSKLPRPTPEEIRAARGDRTQEQAAELMELSEGRVWGALERGENNSSSQAWTLYLLRTGQHPTHELKAKRGKA